MSKKVRKAVIAAAGFGTRFLPQTKAMPKEMLPLVDKPIIQYIVEELVEAGIEDIIIVTGYHKRSIEDHFDNISAELKRNLEQGGKTALLDQTQKITDLANFAYIRQKGPYGNATPIMNVAHLIGNEPFIYTYADDIIAAEPNRFSQMIELYERFSSTILPCIEITKDVDFDRYAVIEGENVEPGITKVQKIVEKPGKANTQSRSASVGGYLLTPEALDYIDLGLSRLREGEEFYLTTYVLEPMLLDKQNMLGCVLKNSRYYDTGNKLEYLKTVIDYGLKHEETKAELEEYLRSILN